MKGVDYYPYHSIYVFIENFLCCIKQLSINIISFLRKELFLQEQRGSFVIFTLIFFVIHLHLIKQNASFCVINYILIIAKRVSHSNGTDVYVKHFVHLTNNW